jgi:hypothetical protein
MMPNLTDFALLDSLEKLHALLEAGGVDTLQWGNGNAKSVGDLWAEIVAGESRIRTPPLQRVVLGVVNVLICQGEHVLIETRQVFASGLTRQRHLPPAEKMQPGERPIDTAMRCLHEELGVEYDAIAIVATSYPHRREVRLSPSYPGLSTEYTFHTLEAHVQGLPAHDFATYEYSADGHAWIMRHDWTWRRVQS